MKYLLKQMWLYIGLALIVGAIVIAIVAGSGHKSVPFLSDYEKLMNKPSAANFLKLLPPDEAKTTEAKAIAKLFEMGSEKLKSGEKITILEGPVEYDEDGVAKNIRLFYVEENKEFTELSAHRLGIYEADGKLYPNLN